MAVYYSTIPTEWYELEGVYIAEIEPVEQPSIQSNATLGKLVGDFPWGPTDEIIQISTAPELEEELIGNTANPENYRGFRALSGKRFGELHVVRISESSQSKAETQIRAPGVYEVTTYDSGDDYELTFSGVDNAPITITSASGDHSVEDDVYTDLKTKINSHDSLGDEVRAVADTTNDELEISGNGNEGWSVSLNTPTTGSHQFTQGAIQYEIDAEYVGAAGNEIAIGHTQRNSGNEFEITVEWGNDVQTFGPFDFDGNSDTETTINDEVEHIDFTWASSYNGTNPLDRPNNVSMAGGTDAQLGTSTNDPYIDALAVLEADEMGGIVWPAEPSHLEESATNGLIAELQSHADKMRATAVSQAVATSGNTGSYSFQNNVTVADTYSDDRLIVCPHRVKQFIEGSLKTVDLTSFVVSAMVNTSPHISPAAQRNAEYLQPIRDFEDDVAPRRGDFVDARQAGAVAVERQKGGTWSIVSGVMSDRTPIPTRQMRDLIAENSGRVLQPYQSEPPYPENVDGAKGSLETMLGTLETDRLIKDFSVRTVQVQDDSVKYETKVDLWGEMGSIVNLVKVGRSVEITEEQ